MRRMYSKPQLLEAVEQESKLNGIKVFEDIKDKDGHARFIEGNLPPSESAIEGLTQTYGKWSLCGTHLLLVIGYSITSGTTITDYYSLGITEGLPEWIYDKVAVLFGSATVSQTTNTWFGNDATTQNINIRLYKYNDTKKLIITNLGAFTASANRNVRIAFDLLIDNN